MLQSHSVLCPFAEFAKNTWSQLRPKIDIWPCKKLIWTNATVIHAKSRHQVNKLIITIPAWSAFNTHLNDVTCQLPFLGKSFCFCPSIRFKHILDMPVSSSIYSHQTISNDTYDMQNAVQSVILTIKY